MADDKKWMNANYHRSLWRDKGSGTAYLEIVNFAL